MRVPPALALIVESAGPFPAVGPISVYVSTMRGPWARDAEMRDVGLCIALGHRTRLAAGAPAASTTLYVSAAEREPWEGEDEGWRG